MLRKNMFQALEDKGLRKYIMNFVLESKINQNHVFVMVLNFITGKILTIFGFQKSFFLIQGCLWHLAIFCRPQELVDID